MYSGFRLFERSSSLIFDYNLNFFYSFYFRDNIKFNDKSSFIVPMYKQNKNYFENVFIQKK